MICNLSCSIFTLFCQNNEFFGAEGEHSILFLHF